MKVVGSGGRLLRDSFGKMLSAVSVAGATGWVALVALASLALSAYAIHSILVLAMLER